MFILRTEKDDMVEAVYDSSHVIASSYNKKTNALTITFKNGGRYSYKDVRSADYMRFETAESQGVVLNSHIKKHSFEKLADTNVDHLITEITKNAEKEKKETEYLAVQTMDMIIKHYNDEHEIDSRLLIALNVYLNKLK